ncbi:MAG: PhzF family phenazine biosynthesis protein [Proteobacteria bacterium]|nr:PhzF family phenazine biosynthesis protein [Pseudomonadota bacterium]
MSALKEIPYFQLNAFTAEPYKGNPAAVCPLIDWPGDATLQQIARENNLSETAFFVSDAWDGYRLRWFTPAVEVDLCGHATLAAGYVILNILKPGLERVEFHSRAGKLAVERGQGDMLTLDFPLQPGKEIPLTKDHAALISKPPEKILEAGENFLLVYGGGEQEIRILEPNVEAMAKFPRHGFIVTSEGEDCDFVSRYFAPNHGILEDPVTGSAHCTLGPYWGEVLGKTGLHARQVSERGGDLYLKGEGGRIKISGHCFLVLEGALSLS